MFFKLAFPVEIATKKRGINCNKKDITAVSKMPSFNVI
jgi:hypothetical protein